MMAMEINGTYNSVYERAYTTQKQETKKQAVSSDYGAGTAKQAKEATGSYGTKTVANQTTDKYLNRVNEKYSSLNIMAGSMNENYRGGSYPEKVDVMIAPSILKKMSSDPKEAQKYERMLSNIPACERWANSMIKAMTGNEVTYRQVWIDDNGNMGSFSISEPGEAQKKWDAQRKEDVKKTFEERLEHIKETSRERSEQLKEKAEEAKKAKDRQAQGSKVVIKSDTAQDKAEKLLSEKLENANDGKIYLDNDDIQTIINAVKEEAQGQSDKAKHPVMAGGNFDLKI